MKYSRKNKILVFAFILLGIIFINPKNLSAQEDYDEKYYESLLDTIVEVQNPVYKPVVTFSTGALSFWGDVQNEGNSLLTNNFGYKIGISTLIGKKHFFKANLFALYGTTKAHNFHLTWQMQNAGSLPIDDNSNTIYPNSAFSTDILMLGGSFEYGFGHIFGAAKRFKPFISIGIGTFFYSPKGNLKLNDNSYYYAWSDGTLRDFNEQGPNAYNARIVRLDNKYETDLSSANIYGTEKYGQNSFAIPVDFGFDFYLSDRVNLRTGISINYTFTDLLDNYDNKIADNWGYPKENNYNDIFTFTYFSLNLDLFSDPKSLLVERVFAEYAGDFDYEILFADQDKDGVLDRLDLCPDTPEGVAVNDSTGCPFDTDDDGVYDYEDQEPNTPAGAIVDNNGVQLTPEVLNGMFNKIENATKRKDAQVIPLAYIWTKNRSFTKGVIPDKFKNVDTDQDGYISFQELLKAINDYFDEKNNFTPNDINELNDYFFSQ